MFDLPQETLGITSLYVAAESATYRLFHGEDGMVGADLYAALYRKQFGRGPSRGALERASRVMFRVEQLCLSKGIRAEDFVEAQMRTLANWTATLRGRDGKAIGFQPEMLVGEGAARRYSAYASAVAGRRAGRDTFGWGTPSGKLLLHLYENDCEVGRTVVTAALNGKPASAEECAETARASSIWFAVFRRAVRDAHQLAKLLVKYPNAVRVGEVAHLRAVVAVVGGFASGLPERMEYAPPMAWSAVADFVAEQPIPRRRGEADLKDIFDFAY